MSFLDLKDGAIYVSGAVTVEEEVSTNYPTVNQVIKRADRYHGSIFNVGSATKSATFKNIHIDGEFDQGKTANNSAIVKPRCGNSFCRSGKSHS